MFNYLRRPLNKEEESVKHRIQSLQISLSSPEYIREISKGEITNPETINYKTFKPEKGGLFCEAIFGPTKDFECLCGKYKRIRYRGKVCEKCRVCVTESLVRREWMGHIELACPVAHIWMTKELPLPSKISLILGIKYKRVEEVVYFVNYVVLEPGFKKVDGELLFAKLDVIGVSDNKSSVESRSRLRRLIRSIYEDILKTKGADDIEYTKGISYFKALHHSTLPFSMVDVFKYLEKHSGLVVGIGAEAILTLLQSIDLNVLELELKKKLGSKCGSGANVEAKKILKRLSVVKWFKNSNNKPEWMILKVIPVLPPDLRPIIRLDVDRFAASDINIFYRRILIRNKRLSRILELNVAHIISGSEKRMLQEAVDSLIDNSSRKKPLMTNDKNPMKSLTDHLKGKQGLFRQNLLGKRVDYSGRSVIVVGPTLKLYQVGLPILMVIKLFQPFIIKELIRNRDDYGNECEPVVSGIEEAEKMMLSQSSELWPIIHKVIKQRPVLLNRAPTLHRLGIQAFEPVLVDGKAICLHPLVTTAFNADFDGDQMAVHLPLSRESVAEARSILLAPWQILGPKDGKPIAIPTQDMLLGCYYLSIENKEGKGSGRTFESLERVINDYEVGHIELNSVICVHTSSFTHPFVKEGWIFTTAGKIIFNNVIPSDFFYVNEATVQPMTEQDIMDGSVDFAEILKNSYQENPPFPKSTLSLLIEAMFDKYDTYVLSKTLDDIKDLGFEYSTKSCTTISAFDIPNFQDKYSLIKNADAAVLEQREFFDRGLITDDERYSNVVKIWSEVKDSVSNNIKKALDGKELSKNPITIMAKSGARGNVSNFVQLSGMRGLMNRSYNYNQSMSSKTIRDIIEIPIKHSFIEGLGVIEYFNSSYGARKGMTDTAMKTAKSGYMTRKLVDAAQEVIVRSAECGTKKGIWIHEVVGESDYETKNIGELILFRTSFQDVVNPETQEIIVKNGELIDKVKSCAIEKCGIKKVLVRSVLFCKQHKGVCQKCFGCDLTTHKQIEQGVAIGVIAAQSIGEPATQLTMRTFHSGGVAGGANITQGFERLKQLFDVVKPKKWEKAILSDVNGVVKSISMDGNEKVVVISNNVEEISYRIGLSLALKVKEGDNVSCGDFLSKGILDLAESLNVCGVDRIRQYIVSEIQKIYWVQGINVSDKYIEVIVRQLTSKVKIQSSNDSGWFVDEIVDQSVFMTACNKLLANNKTPPTGLGIILGLEEISTKTTSFLSAASFQDTKKILTDASVKGQIDHLISLKENVIMGNLVPVGTGFKTPEEVIEMESKFRPFDY